MRRGVTLLVTLSAVLPALALAGCTTMTGETERFVRGQKQTLELEVPDHDVADVRSPDATKPANDPAAPLTYHDGEPENATAVHVRERAGFGPGRVPVWRSPCGGAVLAIPEGAPDPRKLLLDTFGPDRLPTPDYVASRMITDARGREWTTDLYRAPQPAANRSWPIWVANVGGGLSFAPDDGRTACAPFADGPEPFNVLVHAWGHVGPLDLYHAPTERFRAPAERAWVLGLVE